MLRAVANIPLYVGSFTYATLPAAASYSGMEAFASDWGANGTKVRSNGTRWLPMNGQTMLKHISVASGNIANTSTIVLQSLLPIGVAQVGDLILFDISGLTKSGTTDSLNQAIYAGTAGTIADTNILPTTITGLSAANVSGSVLHGFKVISNTSVQRVGTVSGSGLYGSQSATAAPAAVTVSDLSANALYFSFAIQSSSTNNTVVAQEGRILHIAG